MYCGLLLMVAFHFNSAHRMSDSRRVTWRDQNHGTSIKYFFSLALFYLVVR